MTKEYEYSEGSWESVTRTIKAHLEMNELTEPLAKTIMSLYLKGTPVEEMILKLEEDK